MDYNLVWGLYWTIAWFVAVVIGSGLVEERRLYDVTLSLISGLIISGFIFGVGSLILSRFIS